MTDPRTPLAPQQPEPDDTYRRGFTNGYAAACVDLSQRMRKTLGLMVATDIIGMADLGPIRYNEIKNTPARQEDANEPQEPDTTRQARGAST